jgi:hypothetical protein
MRCVAHLARILRVDLKSELFTYTLDDRALSHARPMDGKLLLVPNVRALMPAELIVRYKSLTDIEQGFRVLKSEIDIGSVYHHLLHGAHSASGLARNVTCQRDAALTRTGAFQTAPYPALPRHAQRLAITYAHSCRSREAYPIKSRLAPSGRALHCVGSQ